MSIPSLITSTGRYYRFWWLRRHYRHINGYDLVAASDWPQTLYGDIAFPSFSRLLRWLNLGAEDCFFDLGSGVGKAVLAAASLTTVKQAVGIERIDTLHRAAISVSHRLPFATQQRIRLLQADLMTAELSAATCVFINATGWLLDDWQRLEHKLSTELSAGCRLLIVSKQLSQSCYELLWRAPIDMAYGPAHLHCYLMI